MKYNEYLKVLDEALEKLPFKPGVVGEACRYHLSSGGKRIRPVLLLHFAKDTEKALPFALALELIHNYSLVHDDLPAMDDDDYRRGQETVHKKYGEAIGILAGDALLNTAFEILLEGIAKNPTRERIQAAREIGHCAGIYGMIYGQELDMDESPKVEEMIHYKTGKLFEAAMMAGGLLGKKENLEELLEFSRIFGLLFQITDDLQDLDEDIENNKVTFVTKNREKETRDFIQKLSKKAFLYCEKEKDDFLKELVEKTVNRA